MEGLVADGGGIGGEGTQGIVLSHRDGVQRAAGPERKKRKEIEDIKMKSDFSLVRVGCLTTFNGGIFPHGRKPGLHRKPVSVFLERRLGPVVIAPGSEESPVHLLALLFFRLMLVEALAEQVVELAPYVGVLHSLLLLRRRLLQYLHVLPQGVGLEVLDAGDAEVVGLVLEADVVVGRRAGLVVGRG